MRYLRGDVRRHDEEVEEACWLPISQAIKKLSYPTEREFKAGEGAWVDKLIKVLRRGNRRKKQIVKDLLNAMGR